MVRINFVSIYQSHFRRSRPEVFCKKMFLEISHNSQENTCSRVSFLLKLQVLAFIKKETLAHVLSCEFCKISKITLFTEQLRWLPVSLLLLCQKRLKYAAIIYLLKVKNKSIRKGCEIFSKLPIKPPEDVIDVTFSHLVRIFLVLTLNK